MKTLFFIVVLSTVVFAQTYTVEKVRGEVFVQKGVSEEWISVQKGMKLDKNDIVMTGEGAFLQLESGNKSFLLNADAALGLDRIKNIPLNDLLLSLAREELKRINIENKHPEIKNTAVYGSEVSGEESMSVDDNLLGERRLNGAYQLAKNGYKESAVLAAKETFINYPYTLKLVDKRLFFVELLDNLGLHYEAMDELKSIEKFVVNAEQAKIIKNMKDGISAKIARD